MMAEIHQLKTKPIATNWMCSACGVDAGCNCGAPLMSKGQRVTQLAEAHPEMNNVQIAEMAGVSEGTVRTARKAMSQDYDIEQRLRSDGKPYPAKLKPRLSRDEGDGKTYQIPGWSDAIEEACDDCVNDEERWQRSLGNMAGDAVSLPSYWTREFGRWDKFGVPRDLATLATQAAEAWKQIASEIKQRIK